MFPHDTGHRLHRPVLLEATLQQLAPCPNETYLDLTAGYGGHAAAILAKTLRYEDAVLVDRDRFAVSNLASFKNAGARVIQTDFVSAAQRLSQEKKQFDLILADLGVSSPQLDQAERGFSFMKNGPLDMRMDQTADISAESLINGSNSRDLEAIFIQYGELSPILARRYVTAILAMRPFYDTVSLANCIKDATPGAWQRRHPATKIFQALRIAVNQELTQIERLLPLIPGLLTSGGRVVVISFHSLEDRLVKQYFAQQQANGLEAELTVMTKKPISGDIYDAHNPRARSAKLRAAVKK